jgi:hypothetical protein
MKRISTKIILIMLVTTLILPVTALAQTDSLAVWENIANGTLTSTWVEVLGAEWKGENKSGVWIYNCTTDNQAWTYNETVNGNRWYQTFEVQIDNSDAGIGAIQTRNSSDFYGAVYYLDNTNQPFGDGTVQAYIIYNQGGNVYYWNSTGWETNVSNATDLSGDCEADLLSDFCRVKALWNWNTDDGSNNCTVRFKIWNPSGDEPTVWLFDEDFTYFPGANYTSWKAGLFTDASFGATTEADFTRIFFWDLTYDKYAPILPLVNSQIICPTYDALDFYNDMFDFIGEDIWNQTQLFKAFFNTWDLSSYYSEELYGEAGNQNDTTYVFTNMLVDAQDFYEMIEPGDLPFEIPDNILTINVYDPIDGSDSDGDEFLIRIDSDNNGNYDSYDYAFLIHGSGGFQAYQGWTLLNDPDQWYGAMIATRAVTHDFAEMFRDDDYWVWYAYINWDLLYNGSSNQRIGESLCRISISSWDENDSNMTIWQDWDETEDTSPYPATEEHNATLSPTWLGFNDTSNWGYFWIDDTLGMGDPLADPEDPPGGSMYDDLDQTTTNLLTAVLPLLIIVSVIVLIFGLVTTMGATKESLITIMIVTIFAIILIQIILGL